MLRRSVAALLLVTLLAPLPAGGQGAAEVILDDNSGDVAILVGGATLPNPGRFTNIDLVSLAMSEDAEAVYLTVGVADLDPEPQLFFEGGTVSAFYVIGERQYSVQFQGTFNARLMLYDVTLERYTQLRTLDIIVDTAEDTITAVLERRDMQDETGAPLHPGLQVVDFRAASYAIFGDNCQMQFFDQSVDCPVAIGDQMPNDGEPTGVFQPVLGVQQIGHLRLDSDVRVRSSNGDDTTYVFEVELRNLATQPDQVLLTAQGVPDTWEVRIPADEVLLDGNSTLQLPVLVSTPFAHKHGDYEAFMLEAHSARDPTALGRMEIGVRYTEVPQPAGHHDTLYLHSRSFSQPDPFSTAFATLFGVTDVYFNTLQEDDNDEGIDVPAYSCGFGFQNPGEQQFCWSVYLEPGLEMGLDFDINRTGTITVPVRTPVPMQNAVFSGELMYRANSDTQSNNAIELGTFEATQPVTTGAGGTANFETTFTPTPRADLVHFSPDGANMWINLEMRGTTLPALFFSGPAAPVMTPGGSMQLPLFEYQDPVDDLFHTLTDVDIEMVSSQELYINPGETGLFELVVVNDGVVNDRFALSIDGSNREWASILGDAIVDVKAGEARSLVLAVAAPLEAADGDQADLILEARSTKDSDARALVRLLAEVDTDVDHEDKADLVAPKDEELTTHTVPAPLGLAGAAVALWLARRK